MYSKKADNYYSGNSIVAAGFFFMHSDVAVPGGYFLSQSRRLLLLQVVSNNKSFSVGVQSSTEINAPRGRTLSGRQWFCADRNEV